ncbi:acetate--CoA ligase family protein [Ottowia thiooxydans]|uniref:acetate--CoA ligase family protein n=1 Tax=Ottowia thiooxydans TaxID=219182 RepID=UPI00146AD7EB|nr:acetate--CoA ligase family protein [Ottowia thiooxydans]
MNPRSVAIIGASASTEKFGGRLFACLVKQGFSGRIFPINPQRDTLLGLRAYANISDVPEPVDVAVIALPSSQLLETVRACANAGVGACVLITAQTAEFDEAGENLQREVVRTAREAGMRLVGPNCLGIINPAHGMALTSSATMLHVPSLPKGGVGLVSQSGALMATLFMIGYDHGVGFSRMISVGNQADLELCDFFECLIDDAATRVICLYVEGLVNPERFIALARRARDVGKPVLVVKAGRTTSGQIAALSHTASLAGSFEAFRSACEATGALLIDEPEGMVLAAGAMDKLGELHPGGIAMMVSSGGCGAVTSDRLDLLGLPLLTAYGKNARDALGDCYLDRHINNPIDLGALKRGPNLEDSVTTVRAILADPGVAVMLFLMTPQPFMPEMADALAAAWKDSGKPLLVVLNTGSLGEPIRQRFIASGTAFVSRIDDGIRTLEVMCRLSKNAGTHDASPVRPADVPQNFKAAYSGTHAPGTILTEPEVKSMLASYGIRATEDHVVDSEASAVAIADAIGYPVVLKGVARDISHKSDSGLVQLNLSNAADVRQAYKHLSDVLKRLSTSAGNAIVVQPMIHGATELIMGGRYDKQFGPQLLVGFGGVQVELLQDVCSALAPVTREKAQSMLMSLKLFPLLNGFRGKPAADMEAAVDAICRFSWLLSDLGDSLLELDVNPLLVRPAGQGALAVDGRGVVA